MRVIEFFSARAIRDHPEVPTKVSTARMRKYIANITRRIDSRITQIVVVAAILVIIGDGLAVAELYLRAHLLGRPVGRSSDFLLPVIVGDGSWIVFAPIIAFVTLELRRRTAPLWFSAACHLLLSLILSSAQTLAVVKIETVDSANLTYLTWDQFLIAFIRYTPTNQWMYWVTVVIIYGVSYHSDLHIANVREAELRAHLAQAELENLRVQLRPHFLFNTLNTISSLVRERPEDSENLIGDLSDLLRESLHTKSMEMVSLAQELATLDLYLNIQKARFTARITVNQSIDPEALFASVPHFILQPLVENAFRHGLAKKMKNGRIGIEAIRTGVHLKLRIWDNGPGATLPIQEGVGLGNTRNRLKQLYGDEHIFEPESSSNGFSVVVQIPYVENQIWKEDISANYR